MIGHRQRGFINFYLVFVGLAAVGLLLAYAEALPWIPRIQLMENVNLLPYCLAVLVGVLGSGSLMRAPTRRLHRLLLSEALWLATRQAGYVAACVFALMFATKDRETSRLFLGTYLVLLAGVLTLLHARLPRYLATFLFSERVRIPTLLVARSTAPGMLLPWLREREHLGIQLVGYITESGDPCENVSELPRLGKISSLESVLRCHGVAQVILLDWLDDPEEMERIVETCETEGCRFLIHNSFTTRFARKLAATEEGGHHFLAVEEVPLEDPLNRVLKRGLDIGVSLPIVLFVLPPLTIFVWLAQRIQSPGPLLFTHPRGGFLRREFVMFKFRTMRVNVTDVAEQARANDARVFPAGRLLRRTSLDELPQFINVLRGEMSVVGPRPHLPQHDEQFSQLARKYRIRSLVKPGITGLAQVSGYRGEITDPDRLRGRVFCDLFYVTNWSIWMDLRIIIRTAWQVIRPPKSAY